MSEGERNPFLIAPPPGLVPAAHPALPAPETPPAPVDLIGLPPGVVDATAPQAPAPVATAVVHSLELADGSRHPLDRSCLVGRGPAARPDWPEARLLTVVDPDKSVSKTHAGIRVHANELRVEDLRSTNGVRVTHTDGTTSLVEPGAPVTVVLGDTVSLGQFTLRVVAD
jgi:predicted component of type VI protein secretion system